MSTVGVVATLSWRRALALDAALHLASDTILITGVGLLIGVWLGTGGSTVTTIALGWLLATLPWAVGDTTFLGKAPGIGVAPWWMLSTTALGIACALLWAFAPPRPARTLYRYTLLG